MSVAERIQGDEDFPEIVWIDPPPVGQAIEFQIWLTTPEAQVSGWPGKRSRGTSLLGMIQLANSSAVWVTALQEPTPITSLTIRMSGAPPHITDDLQEEGLRALLFGSSEDGSRFYMDIGNLELRP